MNGCSVCHEFRPSSDLLKVTFDVARRSADSGCEFCRLLLAAMERIHPKGVGAPPDDVATLDCPYESTMIIELGELGYIGETFIDFKLNRRVLDGATQNVIRLRHLYQPVFLIFGIRLQMS
jgi:hypothetical protein